MAQIAKQTIAPNEKTLVLSVATEAGDHMLYDRAAKLFVFNDSAAPITVTLASEAPVAPPTGPEDLVVTVAAGRLAIIGDVTNQAYRDSNGQVHWTYGDHEDVFVAVVQV